jgi:hypothetical protein
VVLNECLYYFSEPVAQAERYFNMLAPGGVMLVSPHVESPTFRSPRVDAIARLLVEHLPLEEERTVSTAKAVWRVSLFRGRV